MKPVAAGWAMIARGVTLPLPRDDKPLALAGQPRGGAKLGRG